MTTFQIRDFTALLATLIVAIAVEAIFLVSFSALASWDYLNLNGEILANPIVSIIYPNLPFIGTAFIAVTIGVAISPTSHKKRNSWFFTLVGVIVYGIIFCKVIFIPHRETEHSAIYVLFTSPQIYLYALGGILASLRASFRKYPDLGDGALAKAV